MEQKHWKLLAEAVNLAARAHDKQADIMENMLDTPTSNTSSSWQKLYAAYSALAALARKHYPQAARHIEDRFRQYGFGAGK